MGYIRVIYLHYGCCVGVRVSSLSKKENGKNTLDFYTHPLSENEKQKLQSFPSSDNTANDDYCDKKDSGIVLTCPICNKPVCDDNDLLNSHVDVCLNQQIIELEKTVSPSTPRKHKR